MISGLAIASSIIGSICCMFTCGSCLYECYTDSNNSNTATRNECATLDTGEICRVVATDSFAYLDDEPIAELLSDSSCSCCPICWEDEPLDELICLNGCSHIFHLSCINDWLSRDLSKYSKKQVAKALTCPLCRAPIPHTLQ